MHHNNFEIPELHSDDISFPAQEHVEIIDWFILEGGEHDEEMLPQEELHEVRLNDISFFIGFPTCYQETYYEYISEDGKRDKCVVEIAALAVQGAPYTNETLQKILEPFQTYTDHHFTEIDIAEDLEGMVWVCRRFTKEQLKGVDFSHRMTEFIALSEKIRAAVFSGGH